ncbi:hypothetical protein [Myroides pelagicus]|uniref:Uncharacterized protein n=1 Tax=Myroides pelagicus TaxID=270914 RepID=A0A7K1GPN8_9FLAO|nr:hypothetical protein [Myroides pelagicus]MEC4115032.1 hypothetical protein [Myroides pelagicus]MTH30738.1 hypothetical protein [Myroides pelagicus]
MKKLFMFLAVAGLATFSASCSSDDNSSDGGAKAKELVVTADKTEVKEGETVNFNVKADGKEVSDANIFVNSEKGSLAHLFEVEGVYKVIAKKEGFTDSKAIEIKVTKGEDTGSEKKSMVLTADKSSVTIGETVKFSASENGTAVEGVTIKLVGGATIADALWKAAKEGEFKFVASKEGYNDSNEVAVKVTKPTQPEEPKANSINVNGTSYDIVPDSAILLAETIKQDGKNYVRLYELDLGDGKIVYYCRFAIDVRTSDFSIAGSDVTGAVARVYKVVIQDPDSDSVIYPGVDPEAEVNVNGFVLAEAGELDFKGEDVKSFEVALANFVDPNGKAKLSVATADNLSIEYEGNIESMYSIDTTESANSTSSKSLFTTGNKLDLNDKGLKLQSPRFIK